MALSPLAAANRRFGLLLQAGDNATPDSHQLRDSTDHDAGEVLPFLPISVARSSEDNIYHINVLRVEKQVCNSDMI
jgi:hypothetical protein